MLYFNIIISIVIIQIKTVCSENIRNDFLNWYPRNENYRGEKFPEKYLSTDGVKPTTADFKYYLETLVRVVNYFNDQPNETDPNVAIGSFLMKAVLKRTLIDYGDKIEDKEKGIIKDIIYKTENVVSHFMYDSIRYGPLDLGYRLSRLFSYDDSLIHSISGFKKNAMTKWIMSDIALNDYIENFDNMSLPRQQYAEFVINMDESYLISDSDYCITEMAFQPMPLRKDADLRPCRPNEYCKKRVLAVPSIAYALSHRLLYLAVMTNTRRCYIISEEVDQIHKDIMCANMYREAVYLARKGYFYRDLFLEHITLCAMLGYEEFYRYNWFKKSASWIDEDGCMVENRNFELNRTSIYIRQAKTSKEAKTIKRMRNIQINEECMHHQMALVINVLAYAIRHAAHFMTTAS